MSDFETKYEEYKNNILKDHWLRNKLCDYYRGSLRAEKDYIDENGVLWKIGVLSGVCGLCLSLFWLLEDRSDTRSIITRIVLFVIMIVCFTFAMHIGKKFKKNLGEMIFYTFRYHQHFKDYIQAEKNRETESIISDMLENHESALWRIDNIDNMSEEELKSLLLSYIRKEGALQRKYKELDRYDRFASELKSDYFFNAEIQKNIDKYI